MSVDGRVDAFALHQRVTLVRDERASIGAASCFTVVPVSRLDSKLLTGVARFAKSASRISAALLGVKFLGSRDLNSRR